MGALRRQRGFLGLFARAEWRAHWRAHLLIAATAAATVAIVVATISGAGRSLTAFDRLRAETHATDLSISQDGVGDDPAGAVAHVAKVDGVTAAAAQTELFAWPKRGDRWSYAEFGNHLIPTFNLHSIAPYSAEQTPLDTPLVRQGRAIDPTRADEVALNADLAAELHVGVGDSLTLQSATDEWGHIAFTGKDPGPPDGPEVVVHVVGIVRSPSDFGPTRAVLHLSPSFVERYGSRMRLDVVVEAQLSPTALRRSEHGTQPDFGKGAFVQPSQYSSAALPGDGLVALSTALRLLAATAGLAGLVAAALAVARQSRVVLHDRATLVAIGSSRSQMVGATVLAFVPTLAVGVGAGIVIGIVGSPIALIGLARQSDPHPAATIVDGLAVLAIGMVAALVTFGALVAAAMRAASSVRAVSTTSARGVQLRRPVPAALGARWALFGEADRGGRSSRSALVALVVGVIAGVAALTVSASIGRLQTDPRLTGAGGGRYIDSGEGTDVYDQALPLLEADPRVAMLVGFHVADVPLASGDSLTGRIHDIRRGAIGTSVLSGSEAQQVDEVALGPKTLDRLHKQVGGTIDLKGEAGAGRFRIVGTVVFPEGDFRPFDEGISLTSEGAKRIIGDAEASSFVHGVSFQWADGVDAVAADKALVDQGLQVATTPIAQLPSSAINLGRVEGVPRFLAVFVALLALVTLGHALAVTVRQRSRELGTLRALGLTPGATTAVVGTQALTLIAIAVLAGVPLGLVAAKQVWAPIAERAHLVVLAVSPWWWLELFAAGMVGATLAMSILPAWRTLRLRPAETLRAE